MISRSSISSYIRLSWLYVFYSETHDEGSVSTEDIVFSLKSLIFPEKSSGGGFRNAWSVLRPWLQTGKLLPILMVNCLDKAMDIWSRLPRFVHKHQFLTSFWVNWYMISMTYTEVLNLLCFSSRYGRIQYFIYYLFIHLFIPFIPAVSVRQWSPGKCVVKIIFLFYVLLFVSPDCFFNTEVFV